MSFAGDDGHGGHNLTEDIRIAVGNPDDYLHLTAINAIAASWQGVCTDDPHVKLLIQAAILKVLPGEEGDKANWEEEFEKQWKLENLRIGKKTDGNGGWSETKSEEMERELRARVEAAMQPTSPTWQALDPDLKDMARAPEDFLRSLNVAVAHVDWMYEASFQKLLGRSHA